MEYDRAPGPVSACLPHVVQGVTTVVQMVACTRCVRRKLMNVVPLSADAHQPKRTCIGCRKQGYRSELVRLVASGSDLHTVLVDTRRRMAGRGAWLHLNASCLSLAVKRRAFGRALRGASEITDVERHFVAGIDSADVSTPAVHNRPT